MAVAEHHQSQSTDDEDWFAQRVEELYDSITCEDGVDSESAGALVAAVETYLELEVNETQVTEALQEVAQTKENRLSKEEFIRFSECLRTQTPEMTGSGNAAAVGSATPDPPSSKRVADDGGITTKAAGRRCSRAQGSGGCKARGEESSGVPHGHP